jgi:hypothetical protein
VAPHSLLFSPSLSSAHGQASTHLVHAGDRAPVVLGVFPTAAVAIPPGETRQSATISLFVAAPTSLILPRSSRS